MRPSRSSLAAASLWAALATGSVSPSARAAEARIDLPSGSVARVAIPDGSRINATDSAGESWVIAGSRSRDDGSEIFVLLGRGEAVGRTLPALPRAARLQAEPVPLRIGERLVGLAWLDGADERSLAVRVARWNGRTWSRPTVVAATGPGSQLALTAARAGDGSWLLAWARFDGQDDEIVWSRSLNLRAWTTPTRVADDDRVPDITPALRATEDGALLAWSHFDGNDYRVVAAGYARGGFGPPRVVGPAGSVFPTFEPASAPRLLYRTAAPRGWEAVEFASSDPGTKVARRATIAADAPERPRLAVAAGRVVFTWSAATDDKIASLAAPWSEEP